MLSSETSEKVLDKKQWLEEADHVINDIKNLVKKVEISKLEPSDEGVFLNLETFEEKKFCISLRASGFQIVSENFDKVGDCSAKAFETVYALLDNVSPAYSTLFSSAVSKKLEEIACKAEEDKDDHVSH